MIPQIYITDYLSEAAAQPAEMVRSLLETCPWLLDARWVVAATPPCRSLFESLSVATLSARENPVTGVLAQRLSSANTPPQFCLLPAHLGLRRDTFSLQSLPVLSATVFQAITAHLQAHFSQDFVLTADMSQRYWWVQPLKQIDARCPWPQDCLFQQAFQWQPEGPGAAVIRQWTNEIQMLLHHLANIPPVADWPVALNSLWFASVEPLPAWKSAAAVVSGQGEVFTGLQAAPLPGLKAMPFISLLTEKHSAPALWVADTWQSIDWPALTQAITQRQLRALTLVLPCAERSLVVTYQRRPRWQFWRKKQTQASVLQHLETQLMGSPQS